MECGIQQSTSFISACYGQTNCSTMSETRLKVWLSKTGKRSSTLKLCTLSPTTEAFKENVKRAHNQALIWLSLEAQNPPKLDAMEYGWVKDDQNKSLQPVTLPDKVKLAPEMVLHLIKCGCHTATPCSSRACSCNSANMKCTIFCTCYNQGCCNPTSWLIPCLCHAHGQHNVQQCKLFGEVVPSLNMNCIICFWQSV